MIQEASGYLAYGSMDIIPELKILTNAARAAAHLWGGQRRLVLHPVHPAPDQGARQHWVLEPQREAALLAHRRVHLRMRLPQSWALIALSAGRSDALTTCVRSSSL